MKVRVRRQNGAALEETDQAEARPRGQPAGSRKASAFPQEKRYDSLVLKSDGGWGSQSCSWIRR